MGAPQPTLAEVNRQIALLETLRDALMEQERINDTVVCVVVASEWYAGRPSPPTPVGNISNAQLYQDVLLDHGQPMHVRDIAQAALERGVHLRGKGLPVDQVRNGMSNSRRFVNIGSNVWWVAGQVIPNDEEGVVENGESRSCE